MRRANKTRQPGRTRLRAEQRRASILDAATEVFASRGYRAGKVSDVAARVGVSEPVIFQNFGSKAALYAAVLDRVAGQIRSEMQALVEHYGSASDLLAHALDPSHGKRFRGPGSHGVLFADAATLTAEPELNEAAKRAVRTVADHLADLVRRGQADGDVQSDLDPEAAAWLLLSVLSTRSLRAAAMPDPHRRERRVSALALRAIVSRTPAPLPTWHRDPARSHHR
jgi:AcrR family transcriptional regulator